MRATRANDDDHAAASDDLLVAHADRGQRATGTFTIERAGTYEVYCSVPVHRDSAWSRRSPSSGTVRSDGRRSRRELDRRHGPAVPYRASGSTRDREGGVDRGPAGDRGCC